MIMARYPAQIVGAEEIPTFGPKAQQPAQTHIDSTGIVKDRAGMKAGGRRHCSIRSAYDAVDPPKPRVTTADRAVERHAPKGWTLQPHAGSDIGNVPAEARNRGSDDDARSLKGICERSLDPEIAGLRRFHLVGIVDLKGEA